MVDAGAKGGQILSQSAPRSAARVNEPGDIADVVLFLLSEQSQTITMREIRSTAGSLLGM